MLQHTKTIVCFQLCGDNFGKNLIWPWWLGVHILLTTLCRWILISGTPPPHFALGEIWTIIKMLGSARIHPKVCGHLRIILRRPCWTCQVLTLLNMTSQCCCIYGTLPYCFMICTQFEPNLLIHTVIPTRQLSLRYYLIANNLEVWRPTDLPLKQAGAWFFSSPNSCPCDAIRQTLGKLHQLNLSAYLS